VSSARQSFVFDTNVIISAALLRQSIASRALRRALTIGRVLVSMATIEELNQVLSRKGFDRYVTEAERIEFLAALIRETDMVEVTESVHACRDPKDDRFLELAVSGHATCIVTGDDDLLSLHPFRGILLLSPRSFLDLVGGGSTE
jgi:putative PIN family toxin of toxin-antitoxin system